MLHFRFDMPLYLMGLYGSVMILGVLALRLLLQKRLPKALFPFLWCLTLGRLLLPFSLSSPLSAPVVSWRPFQGSELLEQTAVAEYVTGDAPQTVWVQGSALWKGATLWVLLYVLGAAAAALLFWRQNRACRQRLKDALLVEQNQTINTLLRARGLGHVWVFTCDDLASPLVCGLWQPRIYLPARMDFENPRLLEHVLAHEAAHIQRRDNYVKALMVAALCLHWYNPLVWLMARVLPADLEAACDAAVLKQAEGDERQSYAASLLNMAVSAGRPTLMYSAFSRTQVEKRVKSILDYKRATALALTLSVLVALGSAVVFATGGQAPFASELSSYCATTSCRWGVKAFLTRDIALGQKPGQRADDRLLNLLTAEASQDPDLLQKEAAAALAQEFGVERSAFRVEVSLCLSQEAQDEEYRRWGLTRDSEGWPLYAGEPVRLLSDEMAGSYWSREEGMVDIYIERDRLGYITAVKDYRQGDTPFDQRTQRQRVAYVYGDAYGADSLHAGTATIQETIVEAEARDEYVVRDG